MEQWKARTLIYELSEYVRAFRDVDFDTRLTEIEQRLGVGSQRDAEAEQSDVRSISLVG